MFIFLLIVLLISGFVLLKRRTRKLPLVDVVETVTPPIFGQWRSQWRSWWGASMTRPTAAPQQLQTWAAQNLAETSALRAWLLALREEEITILAERLDSFCVDLGFAFAWLFDPMLQVNQALNSAMTAAVTAYCTAVWQTVHVRDDIHAYKAFLAFEQNPQKQENQAFAQRLYAQLIAKGLIPPPPPDLVLAAIEERDAYVLAAIRQAAQQDNIAFQQTLREVMQSTASIIFATG